MKLVFFGTSNVALPILEALRKEHEILAVVTTPDVKVGRKQLLEESPVSALAADLKLTTFKPENVKNDVDFINRLKSLPADLYVAVAYGKILPEDVINFPRFKTINVHFSVLPKYRGPSPIQAALLNGDEQTGTSIFILDKNIDDGPLLWQQIVNIEPNDNFFTLSDKLARVSASNINQVVADYSAGKITPLPQDEARASHSKIISKADGKIDWNKPANEIYNQFRAFYLWPGIWTSWKGQVLKITDCLPDTDLRMVGGLNEPGTVLDDGIVFCGQKTALKISRLQLAGKSESSIADFLNGYREFVGSKLD